MKTPIERLKDLPNKWTTAAGVEPFHATELRSTLAACQAADGKTLGQVLYDGFGAAVLRWENVSEYHDNYEKAALAVLVAAQGRQTPQDDSECAARLKEALSALEAARARLALLEWRGMDVRPTEADGDERGLVTVLRCWNAAKTFDLVSWNAVGFTRPQVTDWLAWRPAALPEKPDPFTAWQALYGGTREAFDAARKGVV